MSETNVNTEENVYESSNGSVTNTENNVLCGACKRSFKSNRGLNQHLRSCPVTR